MREEAPTVLAGTGSAEQTAKAADARRKTSKPSPKGTDAPVSHREYSFLDKTAMEVQSKSHSNRMRRFSVFRENVRFREARVGGPDEQVMLTPG